MLKGKGEGYRLILEDLARNNDLSFSVRVPAAEALGKLGYLAISSKTSRAISLYPNSPRASAARQRT